MKVNDNKENEFSLLENHSKLCIDNIQNIAQKKNDDNIDNWEDFKNIIIDFLDNTNVENKKILNDKFLELYNKKKYNFKYDKMKRQNMYKEWKRNSLKFSKFNIFEKNNIINLNNEIFLREYKYFYVNSKYKKQPELLEYAIWIDDLNIAHIRESKNIFIDST